MKKSIFNFLTLFLLVTLSQSVFANNGNTTTVDSVGIDTRVKIATGAFGEFVGAEKGNRVMVSFNSPEYVRRAKALKNDFTGYKIELLTVYNQPLALNDPLFQQFGGISYVKRTKNSYTYLLGGKFEDKKAVEQYLTQIILPSFSKAKAIKFKKGKQVRLK